MKISLVTFGVTSKASQALVKEDGWIVGVCFEAEARENSAVSKQGGKIFSKERKSQ